MLGEEQILQDFQYFFKVREINADFVKEIILFLYFILKCVKILFFMSMHGSNIYFV